MNWTESPVLFTAAGERLVGIAALPEEPRDCGVVIVVGGPQYRAGSHRQFVLLARRLAAAGYPAFRFDYRGMGDSTGEPRNFESVADDIRAAVDAFLRACPPVTRVVLWGLCDAASAILLALHERPDDRVHGVALANPWVRSEASLAQTHLKHYYAQRLMQPAFWRKLLTGNLHVFTSLREFSREAAKARGALRPTGAEATQTGPFQDRMAAGLREFTGEALILLSGQDYTAREFVEVTAGHPAWRGLLTLPRVTRRDIAEADHTFSSSAWRARAENETLAWLDRF